MRGIPILCFLLALPVLAALGHDIYITYQDQDFYMARQDVADDARSWVSAGRFTALQLPGARGQPRLDAFWFVPIAREAAL